MVHGRPTTQVRRSAKNIADRSRLAEAARITLASSGAATPGIDGVDKQAMEAELPLQLERIRAELLAGNFRPLPARRVYIPKANGKQRPLGIPSLRDRIVQRAMLMVMEPTWESDFHRLSYGFRPERSVHHAIRTVKFQLQDGTYGVGRWDIEGDLASYFDTVHHRLLMRCLRKRIRDRRFLNLVWRTIKAGHVDRNLFRAASEGVPLRGEIDDLLGAAERADVQDGPEPQSLPEELKRRETLKAKLDKACAKLARRAKSRADSERAEYERKVAAREQREGRRKGKRIKAPEEEPRDEEQINLTDSDSALMRKNKRGEYRQCYNAQAVVDAEGSQLVLGSRVSTCASDRGELVADVDSMPGALGSPDRVLADNGYATGTEVSELENRGLEVLVAVGTEDRRRAHDFRPPAPEKAVKEPQADWLKRMQEKMSTDASRAHYRLRKQTVEPVFGIVKEAMGFRQFLLRGLEKVEAEWALVMLAYNCKRLNNMRLA